MPKAKSKKAATKGAKKRATVAKKSRGEKKEASASDSSHELEAVKTKKGEPADNLRQRAEWFQKRHGG